jgi:hypothetical protein
MGMEFFTTDLDGMTLINPPEEERRAILRSVLDDPDADYPEVYLTTDDGDVIGYRSGGVLFQEEDGEIVRIIPDVDLDTAARAWDCLAGGNADGLDSLPWQPAGD